MSHTGGKWSIMSGAPWNILDEGGARIVWCRSEDSQSGTPIDLANARHIVDLHNAAERTISDIHVVERERDQALKEVEQWKAEFNRVYTEHDEATAEVQAAHDRIDEAGGIPNRDPKIGELSLLQRVSMLAEDLGVFERQHERDRRRIAELEAALQRTRKRIERDHAGACAKTKLGIGCLWCEAVGDIDAALSAPAQPATAAKDTTHIEPLLGPCFECECTTLEGGLCDCGCHEDAAPPAPAARVCLGCGHFKHSNRCNCGCTMRPAEGGE